MSEEEQLAHRCDGVKNAAQIINRGPYGSDRKKPQVGGGGERREQLAKDCRGELYPATKARGGMESGRSWGESGRCVKGRKNAGGRKHERRAQCDIHQWVDGRRGGRCKSENGASGKRGGRR